MFLHQLIGICSSGELRLNVGENYDYFYGNTMYDEAYYMDEVRGTGLLRGRVEMCDGSTQEWGTICDDSWDDEEASVACQQMGFSRYGTSSYSERVTNGEVVCVAHACCRCCCC